MGTVVERTKGMAEQAAGKIAHAIGKVIGNEELQAKGKAEELKGDAREEGAKIAGRVKATAEEAGGAVEKAASAITGSEKMDMEGAAHELKGKVERKLDE
jgi:uncharacterized protein YjbJ (UPF0337 family)